MTAAFGTAKMREDRMDQLTGYRNALREVGIPAEKDDVRLRYARLDRNWFSRPRDRDPEILLTMKDDTPDGGTDGEFTIYFGRQAGGEPWMRVEVFNDALRVLANHPEVMIGLTGLCQDPGSRHGHRAPSPEEVEAMLKGLGIPDCTLYVEGGEPGVTPTSVKFP